MTEKDKELIEKARGSHWSDILHMVDLADTEEAKDKLRYMLKVEFQREERNTFGY